MPLWLALLIIGIVLVVAARYWITDPLFSRWAYGGGVLCVVLAVVLLVVGLLGLASPRLAAGDAWPLAVGGGAFMLGALNTNPVGDPAMNPQEPDPLAPKGWLESRTVIFNAIVAILTVAYGIAQVVSQNPSGLDPRVISAAGLIVAVGNLWLRQGTTAPIAGTAAAEKVARAKQSLVLETLAEPGQATRRVSKSDV